ncbi:MAG: glutamine synthetase [Halioglobus sp.]|jgi:glutamine synthetase
MSSDRADIAQWLAQNQISEVECLIPDISGNARGKFVPVEQFLGQSEARLPEAVLIQTVTGEYSDAHWDFVEPTDADMVLLPDPDSLRLVPWASKPTAQIIHNCFTMDGEPHPLSSRNILRRILNLYKEDGLRPVVAPEMEFYLVARNTDSADTLHPPIGRSGRAESSRLSFSIDAMAEFDDFVTDMYRYARAQKLDIDTINHENGAAQMEINFVHGNALSLADQVFTFKRTVREAAHKHGIYATFMAKPMQSEPGSAMHIHQSIVEMDGGANIFIDENGEHTPAFLSYIAGLQRYTPELISLYASNVNSYRRLAPHISAPVSMDWGFDNRTTAFRVPSSPGPATRVENRFPGADVNPYLAFAATLGSGYLGMKKQLQATQPHSGTANENEVEVARSLEEGVRHLRDSPEIEDMFGERFLSAYTAVKLHEFEAFNQVVSAWEREHLLLQV